MTGWLSLSYICILVLKKTTDLTIWTFAGKVISLLFKTLFRFDIAVLPRSNHFLISWLWSPSAVILEPKKMKSDNVSTFSPSICHEVIGWTPRVDDRQGGLACCGSWGCKESDITEWLNWTELNWTDSLWSPVSCNYTKIKTVIYFFPLLYLQIQEKCLT